MAVQHLDKAKNAIDATLVTGLATLPVWVQWLTPFVALVAAVLGVAAGIYRLRINQIELKLKQRAEAAAGED